MAKNTQYKLEVSEDFRTVTCTNAAGTEKFSVAVEDLPGDIKTRAIADSVADTIRDCWAGSNDEADPAGWGFNRAKARMELLKAGTWSARGTGGTSVPSILVEALHRAAPTKYPTLEDAQTMVESWSKEETKAKRALLDPEIKAITAERAMARAAKATPAAARDL